MPNLQFEGSKCTSPTPEKNQVVGLHNELFMTGDTTLLVDPRTSETQRWLSLISLQDGHSLSQKIGCEPSEAVKIKLETTPVVQKIDGKSYYVFTEIQ